MRPLRLTMTAFGPYAATETVDFDALTELGLFVVAGNNGSGKTTIFDALHYCLYGTLPGRRATYTRLRSDHAPPEVECKVELDFSAGGHRWRVTRSPKQMRPKRRGAGQTESLRRASLFRLEHGRPVAVANKIGEVDAKCRELVGLSGAQFERVALLPQGEFSRVLRESSTDRRKLLRTLFSSEIFDDATALLTERAADAAASNDAQNDQIEQQLGAVAIAVEQIVGHPTIATVPDLRSAIDRYRAGPLSELESQAADLAVQQVEAAQAHRLAITTAERVAHRDLVQQRFVEHEALAGQNQDDLHRLRNARAAIPVVNLSTVACQQNSRLVVAERQCAELRTQVVSPLHACGMTLPTGDDIQAITMQRVQAGDLVTELTSRRDAHRKLASIDETLARLRAAERRSSARVETLQEDLRVVGAQRRGVAAEQERLSEAPNDVERRAAWKAADTALEQRRQLVELDAISSATANQRNQLEAQIAEFRTRHDAAQAAQMAQLGLHAELHTAVEAFAELERLEVAAREFAEATAALDDMRDRYQAAQSRADQLWDSFIRGTAVRVAEALREDEPCPVCGSSEHPVPARAQATDEVVTEVLVTRAREAADEHRRNKLVIETQIETLKAVDAGIGSLRLDDLGDQIVAAKSHAMQARDRADANHSLATSLVSVDADLETAEHARRELIERQQRTDEDLNRLIGALGEAASDRVTDLETRAADAAAALAEAEHAQEQLIDLAQQQQSFVQTLQTLEVALHEARRRHQATSDQLLDREQQRNELLETIGETPTVEDHQVEAAQTAVNLLHDLQTAVTLRDETAFASQRADAQLGERLAQSPFDSAEAAQACFIETDVVDLLETTTTDYAATADRLKGQLHELAGLPDLAPDLVAVATREQETQAAHAASNRDLVSRVGDLERFDRELVDIADRQQALVAADAESQRLERVAALVKGDNLRNTSLENWVLGAHLRDVVDLANIRLARSTQQRFQLCVLDDGENRRGTWGLDLGVEDTVTGTRRPTAGLSGGELFQASLALALGLADVVMAESAGVRIDALFIDEGFGSLDESSVERAIDLLDELRGRGAMVGVITHVPALLDALPRGITVESRPDGSGSTIRQRPIAA